MDSLPSHPIIPHHKFVELHKKFCAIDNTLILHYTNHNVDPVLVKILDSAATLAQRRINVMDLEVILHINSKLFSIYSTGSNGYDYQKIHIKFPYDFNQGMIQTRKTSFMKDLESWIQHDLEKSLFSCTSIQEIIQAQKVASDASGKQSPSKVTKPSRKSSLADLKNDSSKFKFQERFELIEKQKSNGMSLLERIKLKEKLKKEQLDRERGQNTPQLQYEKYLLGKSPQIYDIVYQLSNTNRIPNEITRTFSCQKICTTIVDSHDYPLDRKEVEDALRLMEKRLGEKFVLLERGGVTVLKVGTLDRENDLKSLTEQ